MALAVKRLLAGDATVGDLKYSYLTEAQFIAENGYGWVLDDGRSIVGSKLHQRYRFTTTKDVRGLFIRAKNNGRTGTYADPSGERTIGSIQGHAFQTHTHAQNSHNHGVNDPGHGHTVTGVFYNNRWVYGAAGGGSFVGSFDPVTIPNSYSNVSINGATATNQNQSATGAASEPTAAETRPVNIALNVFLKIN